MKNNIKKAIACLKEMNFKPRLDSFEDRIIIQKTLYLLKISGADAGFHYNLYLKGPYSPNLTEALYNNKKDVESLRTDYSLNKRESEAAYKIKILFETKAGLLEIAATYLFFIVAEKLDHIAALKKLKKLKPFFSETQIAVGVSRAKSLIPQEINEKMRKESAEWETASISDSKEW